MTDALIINQTYNLLDSSIFDGQNFILKRPHGLSSIDRIDVRSFKGQLQPYLQQNLENIKIKIFALPSVDCLTLNINFNSSSSTPVRRYQYNSNQNTGKIEPLLEFEQKWFYDETVEDQFYNNISLAIHKIAHYFEKSFSRYISINDYKPKLNTYEFYNSNISSFNNYDRITGSNQRACYISNISDYRTVSTYGETNFTPIIINNGNNPAWKFINALTFDDLLIAINTGTRHIIIKDAKNLNNDIDIYAGYHNYDHSWITGSVVYDNGFRRNSINCINGVSAQIIKLFYNQDRIQQDFSYHTSVNNILYCDIRDDTRLVLYYKVENNIPYLILSSEYNGNEDFKIKYVSLEDNNVCLLSFANLRIFEVDGVKYFELVILNSKMSVVFNSYSHTYYYIGRFFDEFINTTEIFDRKSIKDEILFNIDLTNNLDTFNYSLFYHIGTNEVFDYSIFSNEFNIENITNQLVLITNEEFITSLSNKFPDISNINCKFFYDENNLDILCYNHTKDTNNIYNFTTFRYKATDVYRLYADMTSSYESNTITYEMKNYDVQTNFATAPLDDTYYTLVDENNELTTNLQDCYIKTPVMCMKYLSGGSRYIIDPTINFAINISTNEFEFTTDFSTLTNEEYTLSNQPLRFKFRSNEAFETIMQSINFRILLQNEFSNISLVSTAMNNLNGVIYYLNEEAKIRYKSIQTSSNQDNLIVNVADKDEQLTPQDLIQIYGSLTVSIDWLKFN